MWQDHPRVGGETAHWDEMKTKITGPSPRGRGNPSMVFAGTANHGTIPAWAGKPDTVPPIKCALRDHPRVGGETSGYTRTDRFRDGPSPRGRGNPCGI